MQIMTPVAAPPNARGKHEELLAEVDKITTQMWLPLKCQDKKEWDKLWNFFGSRDRRNQYERKRSTEQAGTPPVVTYMLYVRKRVTPIVPKVVAV